MYVIKVYLFLKYNIRQMFKSQMKLDMDEHGKPGDRARTGIILYVILWVFAVVVSFTGWDFVKLLFGLDEKYRELFCFSLLSLALSWILAAVISKEQYEKKERAAADMPVVGY